MMAWHVHAIAVATLVIGVGAAAQPANDARRFNGTWQVTLACPTSPQGVLGFMFVFPATVSDGHLHGQYGTPGWAPSVTYDGTIQPDGRAEITANGLTGDANYNVAQTRKGVAYAYRLVAQFDAARGHGHRTEIRPCDVDFVRQ